MAGRAKKQAVKEEIGLDELFHGELWLWYAQQRRSIRAHYNPLTRRFLDYNAPLDPRTPRFLRQPQSEALEMYVFLKENMVAKDKGGHKHAPLPVHDIFDRWFHKQTPFALRPEVGLSRTKQQQLVRSTFNEQVFQKTYSRMKEQAGSDAYANYIFALTMGTGKTLLMLTCIFYDFLLADRYPDAPHYARNALIFAPDLTVLQSLRADIEQFDRVKVIPSDYLHIFDGVTPHFLQEPGDTLDGVAPRFNIVVSNAQKVILKRNHKARADATGDSAEAKVRRADNALFKGTGRTYTPSEADKDLSELLDLPAEKRQAELVTNRRYEILRGMTDLGVFIDEAHHAYGAALKRDMDTTEPTSLRNTVNRLHADLSAKGTRMVGCYNFTGTPYADGEVFPEVVYTYGLKMAVDNEYLKKVKVIDEDQLRVKEPEFLADAIDHFMKTHKGKRYEGMLPKLAIFGTGVEDLRTRVYDAVVAAISKYKLTGRSVLVNVQDSTETELERFRTLDTPASDVQFILLIGKGREGWNCRSLFGVLLYREPRSRVFVLQASTRCLRSIACPPQQTGFIYLSKACRALLDQELAANYKVTVGDLGGGSENTEPTLEVRARAPVPEVHIVRTLHKWDVTRVTSPKPPTLTVTPELLERYRIIQTETDGLRANDEHAVRLMTEIKRPQRRYSAIMLCSEIARYLGEIGPIEVEGLLERMEGGIDGVLEHVNQHNGLLYDCVIPKVFAEFYRCRSYTLPEPASVPLVRDPGAVYRMKSQPGLVIQLPDDETDGDRSFHLDTYVFDSGSERKFFEALLASDKVKSIYFTGMLTQNQSDFFIDYLDPTQKNEPRRYFPDFLVELTDGRRIIYEVKPRVNIPREVEQAKAKATEALAKASERMTYVFVPSEEADKGNSLDFLAEQSQALLPGR